MAVTILCVQEDQRALMARSLLLSIAGYEVHTATSEDTAVRVFARQNIDIVLASHSLAQSNGVALTRLLKEVEPEIQVVLLCDCLDAASTADHADLTLATCMEPEEFLAAIGKLAARRKPLLVQKNEKVALSN